MNICYVRVEDIARQGEDMNLFLDSKGNKLFIEIL